MRAIAAFTISVVAALAHAGTAQAASYPAHPVTIVVSVAPGGPGDVIARIIGKRMSEMLGQPFVIENRPGAAGNIAAEQVAHSPPDGHTLLMANIGILASNAALYRKLPYDPEKDFVPISLIGTQPNVLVINPSVLANSVADLIALAKANPGQLNFASSGRGMATHLAGELFKAYAKVDIVHVTYKGITLALNDVMAGHVHMMFATSRPVIGPIRHGRVRALAVTTPKRAMRLPELPTLDELGLKGFDASTWHGLVAPAGTPKEIIDTINFAANTALKDPEVRKALADLGVEIIGSTPKQFDDYIKSEIQKWTALIGASAP